MRLAYSAMCRAAVRVVWTCTATGFDAGEGMPSRFLPMVANTSMEEATRPPSPWTRPTTAIEAEAWLRRRIADPGLDLVDRLAAAAVLGEEAPWRPRDPIVFAGVLERGVDTGLLDSEPVLSASQADSYTHCPRRYAFERRLHVDGGGSSYQEIGSLIHDVLETVESAAAARGDDHATVDEALAVLDAEFAPEVFGGGPWGEAWRARARAIVTRLYELWPGSGAGVAFEASIDVELGGVRWTGRIDRVERRGDALHVVDYKTGTRVPTVADAARSIQLGLYVLGLREGADEPVLGGEFWYPAAGMNAAKPSKSVSVRRLDLDELDEVRTALSLAATGILAEDWTPITGDHCSNCAVRLVCPEWPEGQEAYVT
jgi:RecB family exonuclease